MSLDDADTDVFKSWVIGKLEAISDADSEVLADYVIALVKTDDSQATAKDSLKDFIGDSANVFVDEVFRALATRSYDPSRPQARPTAPVYEPPRRATFPVPGLPNVSRKRSYYDWDAEAELNRRTQAHESADRPAKHSRRGRGGYGDRGGRVPAQPVRGDFGAPPFMQLPAMPTPPPGMPPFDLNDPMAAMMAMGQAMGFLPPAPGTGPFSMNGYGAPNATHRCRDYDTKGFCMRGASCPYEHDDNAFVVPPQNDEYDPSNAMMFELTPNRVGHVDTSPSGGGRVKRGGASHRGGKPQRADISIVGMNHNRNITSIVVQQIPAEHFNEEEIRDFFGAFGHVEEVTMQPYKRLAIVRYDDYDSAKAAYTSPKSVFDNRFVKIYWHSGDNVPKPPNGHIVTEANEDVEMGQSDPDFDYEEVAIRQAEAQRKHDDARKQREEVEQRRQELEQKLQTVNSERTKMAELIAKKTGQPVAKSAEEETTARLEAQLDALRNEAISMGIDVDADDYEPYSYPAYAMPYSQPSPYRGRGGYRGRGTRGRGHYQPSYRGGGFSGGRATMSLDNRPKTVAVTFADGQYQEHEEALRQYLMFNELETATLAKHPGHDDTVLVTFQQRYEAENLMAAALYEGPLAASDLPKQLGKVVLAWYKLEGAIFHAKGSIDVDSDQGNSHAKVEDMKPEKETKPLVDQPGDMDTWED